MTKQTDPTRKPLKFTDDPDFSRQLNAILEIAYERMEEENLMPVCNVLTCALANVVAQIVPEERPVAIRDIEISLAAMIAALVLLREDGALIGPGNA